jgi:hypothetical protein
VNVQALSGSPANLAVYLALVPLGVAGAGVVYWIVTKYTSAYNRVFTWISIGTLLLSLIPDVGIYTNPGPDDIGATIPIVIILMLTHVFAAYISVKKLTKEE